MTPPSTRSELEMETLKIRRLRATADLVCTILQQTEMPLADAVRMVQAVRVQAIQLFPGREHAYDILYAPRFARVLRDKYRVSYPE